MHVHILGICGTFMGSLAILAREMGFKVSGCDANVYPPMSTQLEQQGIDLIEGYDPSQVELNADIYVIGNAMSRGNPLVECILDRGLPYTSGPQFLADHVLRERWVLAVSGTHGKTTTSTMLASILDDVGMAPGFLIGGVPLGFSCSARLGDSPFFVIEADEYDSAFFDKRSKFVHYRPQTLIINNLEFDHADIFDSIADIQRQFHHMVRTVPSIGRVISPAEVPAINELLAQGLWSEHEKTGAGGQWQTETISADGTSFRVKFNGETVGEVNWSMTGEHSVNNGLMAIAAAKHVGVKPEDACMALSKFGGVKRRMEQVVNTPELNIYDDFAHHPTAIATTLAGLRNQVGSERVVAVIEPRSNTMKAGVHNESLSDSAKLADQVYWFDEEGAAQLSQVIDSPKQLVISDYTQLVEMLDQELQLGGHIVVMSNGGFKGLVQYLQSKF